MNTTQPIQIIDTDGNTHTMALTATGILLDGKPCRLVVREARITLLSSNPAIGSIPIAPAAFWRAFAGGDPTPESAGVIQAQALAHWSELQPHVPLKSSAHMSFATGNEHYPHTQEDL